MSALSMPKVVLIVLNWNGADDTLECLASLQALDYPAYDVIVVDNASSGPDVERITAQFGATVQIIRNEQNHGFAEGNNIGIRQALQQGADFVLLLNNDTVVKPDFLREMIEVAQQDPRIGVLSPVIYDYRDPAKIQNQGHRIGWYGPPAPPAPPAPAEARWADREAVLGTAMLIKRAVIERVGLLCAEYFYQVEDTDYSVRAARSGFRVGCALRAGILHKGSVSLNRVPGNKLGYFVRNRFIFRTKYATNFQLAVFLLWFFAVEMPMNLVYYWARFRDFGTVRGLAWGTREGLRYLIRWRKEYGKCIEKQAGSGV